jgi:hypothetical protein
MDSPYGVWKRYPGNATRLGKASHLALHPGNVQHKNVLLATAALSGRDGLDGFTTEGSAGKKNLYASLATNVLLPLNADELLLRYPNGTTVPLTPWRTPATAFQVAVPSDTVLGVRVQRGMLAVRTFECDGAAGFTPSIALVGDAEGLALGAVRLVCQHFVAQAPHAIASRHIRWGALMVASRFGGGAAAPTRHSTPSTELQDLVDLVARSPINSTTDGAAATWTSQTTVGATTLAVSRSLTCQRGRPINASWNCLQSRTVNGTEIVPSTRLRVNGVVVVPGVPQPPTSTSAFV